jgi:hypothetical protein
LFVVLNAALAYHERVDLGSLYISLLILKGLSFQQAYTYAYCAQTKDPVACYDAIPDRHEMEESYFYGDFELPPQYTPGQFYHYVDPRPLKSRDQSACLPTPPAPPSHCY